MQGNTDVAYCQAASEPVAYRLVFFLVNYIFFPLLQFVVYLIA